MSKVICDVCGTTYPETATVCPICGSARNSAEQTAAGPVEGAEAGTAGYVYVKGGRFSKKNVRRRTKGMATPTTTARRRSNESTRDMKNDEEPNNTGLVIVVILLLVAIICVLAYLIVPSFLEGNPEQTENQGENSSHVGNQNGGDNGDEDSSGETDPERIACESLKLSHIKIVLSVGGTETIVAQLTPADTTDTVKFVSEDPSIAAVDPDTGVVTMLAEGSTVITVICGDVTAQCPVTTQGEDDPGTDDPGTDDPGTDDPGETGDDEPVEPGVFEFSWSNRYLTEEGYGDCTLQSEGETWKSYSLSLDMDPALITWTTDDDDIATVENGIVTAVGPGTTKIHATYNGVTYTCVIRCDFEEVADDYCVLNTVDVTLYVGESFDWLKLKDSSGYTLPVIWKCDTDGVSISGNVITAVSPGNHTVYTVYNGKTYSCTVRVKE